jgi:autotransporter-associated beta strand protein/T5SS/PEP-CTERM-associated repeat protein
MKRCWIAGWVLCLSLATSYSADNLWTGATSTDWNDGTNWSEAGVPDTLFGDNAVVATTTPNIATIAADISATPNDIIVNSAGRIDHRAGTAGTGGGSYMWVENGVYNLANTATLGLGISGFAQGTGSLNATGNLLVGAWGDNRNGTINVNTTGTFAVSGELFFGDSTGSQGALNLESGAMTVNNKIFVGNNRGTGTMTMSGGTLTKTGGDETFVGRDAGTGTLTQSGGTVTLNHNLYVGQSSGSTGTYNISGNSVLNVGRDFVIGRESGTGSLNMTGGTITKTGDEKFIIGHNNGTGTVVHSGGTINVNQNELYIGNENTNARGTYTLSGTGALNVANEVVVGRESGTGILNVDGGTMTTTGNGNMYIGRRNGTGTLNQTAGLISVIKEFGVGTRDDNKIGTGTYNLSDTGAITVANNIFIGKEQGASGTMTMTGGTMTGSDKLILGHNQATGALTQSGGTVNVQNEVYIGNENSASSVGAYTLSGSANLNVGNEVQVGRDNGTGTFNLNGGTVNANKISGGTGSATVNFNGGVLKAKKDESNLIENLDVADVQSGGLKIDSNGFNVSTSQILTGTGGLEKSGAGQLTLRGANTYSGTTTVAAGVLRVEKTGLNAIVDAAADTLVAEFTLTPAAGAYSILPGPLAGAQTFSATGLGANQQATFDRSTSTVTVTELVTGSTFASLYPANSEATLGSNGLSNLMNYALGGVGESSIPALPQLTVGVNGLTLTGNVRTDDTGLTIRGETATSLSGPWTPVDLSATGAPSAVLNTTVKSFTVPIDPAEPKKFLRFHVTE